MSGSIIFNYKYFTDTICKNIDLYTKNKDKIVAILEPLDPYTPPLQDVDCTKADFLLESCMGIAETNGGKYFKNSSTSKSLRPLNNDHRDRFHKLFPLDLPMFLDTNQFFKSMMLSSNLLFQSGNLKLCLAAMVDRPKIELEWTAEDILEECKNYVDVDKLHADKIQKCLEKYSEGTLYDYSNPPTEPADPGVPRYALFEETKKVEPKKYKLRLTELIACYNEFLGGINKTPKAKSDA